MSAFTPAGYAMGLERKFAPGDIALAGDSLTRGAIATVGAGTWTAAAIVSGIVRRTGPVGAYADATDTAVNILAALAGNAPNAEVTPGMTFRQLFINTVAFAMTLTPGTGIVTGLGTIDCAASLVREYLWTVLNASPTVVANAATTNGSADVTFNLPAGMSALPIGPSPQAYNITPGMTVTGTGIAAGTTVLGVTQGQGGITGVTLSANATATGDANLTFGPTLRLDGIRAGTL